MAVEVHGDALLLPGWVPVWGNAFGDLMALIYMNLIGRRTACEAASEGAGCRSRRQAMREWCSSVPPPWAASELRQVLMKTLLVKI